MFRVLIKENPFAEMLRSAYEALKRECVGSMFGERFETKKNLLYVIEEAHPVQLVKRFPTTAEPLTGSIRADLEFLYGHIGNFHSHVTSTAHKNGEKYENLGSVFLSEVDEKNLKDCPGVIEIIVALRQVSKCHKAIGNEYLVSGYIRKNEFEEKNYRFDVGAYSFIDGRARRARVEVPRRILRHLR